MYNSFEMEFYEWIHHLFMDFEAVMLNSSEIPA